MPVRDSHGASGLLTAFGVVALFPSGASAQFGSNWIEYTDVTATRLGVPPTAISSSTDEIDFACGDLDRDGRTDLVVVRKQPGTTFGTRTNILLMNEAGVLVDRTPLYATASDVHGDLGFLTPTRSSDVRVADFDGDGWLDVITCAAAPLSGELKLLTHPRVYHNLGADGAGNWLGLRHEGARIPQLLIGATLAPANGSNIAVGNVAGNSAPDLYIIDADLGDLPNLDTQDRLLINDGNGYFVDQTALVPAAMLNTGTGTSGHIADLNGDGFGDVAKSMESPVYVVYGSASGSLGNFQTPTSNSIYNIDVGDLNHDGKIDLIASADVKDSYLLNTGNDASGRVIWSPPNYYQFLAAGDDGIGGNARVADLNGDGFADTLHSNVDLDLPNCFQRLHLYHNLGGIPGASVTLREERENATFTSWLGAKGLHEADLQGTYDTAVFDIDGDGDDDLVIGRCGGTYVFEKISPVTVCQPTFLPSSKGDGHLMVCGQLLASGYLSTLSITGGPSNGLALLVAGTSATWQPALGGTVLAPFSFFGTIPLTPTGTQTLAVPGGGGTLTGVNFYVQALLANPLTTNPTDITEIVRLVFLP